MATMNVSVPEPMKSWVDEQIASGKYANSSDYIRDLIRKDQQFQTQVRALQQAIDEGEHSGIDEGFSMDALQTELDEEWVSSR